MFRVSLDDKGAGEFLPRSQLLTGLAKTRRSVCAPALMALSFYRRPPPHKIAMEAPMFSKNFQDWLNQKFQRSRRTGKLRQQKPRTTLRLEPLEQRIVPSIVWWNQGDMDGRGDTDGFDHKFGFGPGGVGPGPNAVLARKDVVAAIDEWNHVITRFNYPELTLDGYNFQLKLQMKSMGWDPVAGGALGDGAPTSYDVAGIAGIPTMGSVDINNDVPQWYLDPTPYDNGKFPSLENPFVAAWPSMPSSPGADLVQVTLHEVCHAVGFVENPRFDQYVTNPAYSSPDDDLRIFHFANNGPQVTMTTYGGPYHLYGGAGTEHRSTNSPNEPDSPSPTCTNPRLGIYDDLIAEPSIQGRKVISDLDAQILGQVYRYTITPPSTLPFGTFLASYNSDTGQLTVNADPTQNNNVITLDTTAATQTVNVSVNSYSWTFTGVSSIVVNGNRHDNTSDTVRIKSTLAGVTTTIHDLASLASTTVDLGKAGIGMQGIAGPVDVGAGTRETVNIDDTADKGSHTVAVTNTGITGLAAAISYEGQLSSIEVRGGSGGNTFNVLSVLAYTRLVIDTGSGGDAVNIGDATHFVNGNVQSIIPYTLLISGNAGTTVTLDDEANTGPSPTYQITGTGVTRLVTPPGQNSPSSTAVTCSGVGHLLIHGGNNHNVFAVTGTPAGNVTLQAGSGSDSITVGDKQNSLNQIATLNIQGGTGTTLALDDEGTQNAIDSFPGFAETDIYQNNPLYVISDQAVQRTNIFKDTQESVSNGITTVLGTDTTTLTTTVTYSRLASLEVDGANLLLTNNNGIIEPLPSNSSSNTLHIAKTSVPITINAGNGGDTVNVGSDLLPGVVSAYQGEGNANDAVGGNNGTVVGNVTFVAGHLVRQRTFDPMVGYSKACSS
jgi:hypothetical protein